MIRIGKGGQREVDEIQLSRYACYLIIQNADPSKDIVALGQTYFAAQTRRQELADQSDEQGIEDQRRLVLRSEMREHNVQLADAAKDAGVVESRDYAVFQNHGYMGLYGGMGAREIHARKGLKKGQEILDHMGSAELAANLFRATQAEQKLRREGITGKTNANRAHEEVGQKVRRTIKELGGTMPEELPAAESIKTLESHERKSQEALGDARDGKD
jgi:DNA-damage-inducible protein D